MTKATEGQRVRSLIPLDQECGSGTCHVEPGVAGTIVEYPYTGHDDFAAVEFDAVNGPWTYFTCRLDEIEPINQGDRP